MKYHYKFTEKNNVKENDFNIIYFACNTIDMWTRRAHSPYWLYILNFINYLTTDLMVIFLIMIKNYDLH